jgi:phosphatidylinositol glycan class P protein
MGIHYYPDRWWALAVPAWLVILIIYIYVALASYNTRYLTLPMSSCENLVDECGQVAIIDRRTGKIARNQVPGTGKVHANSKGSTTAGNASNPLSAFQFGASEDVDWKKLWSIGTDGVLDVPIGGVCEVLYGNDQDDEG